MLKCEGGCQQMYDEYYRMPDGKIFCEKCWRHGREVAEMRAIQGHNQRLQVQRDKVAFDQKRNADQVRLEQLEHAIKLEKGKCQRAWSEYEENYYTSDKPYNYEEVELLKRQRNDLEHHLRKNEFFRLPSTPPFPDNTNYFNNAKFISKAQAYHFETITLPNEREIARKAAEERLRIEREQKKIEEDKRREREESIIRHKAELAPIEERMLKREKQPLQVRVRIAKETYREDVMLRCSKDSAKTVRDALKQNPRVTAKVLIEIKKRETVTTEQPNIQPTNYKVAPTQQVDSNSGCWIFICLSIVFLTIVYFMSN